MKKHITTAMVLGALAALIAGFLYWSGADAGPVSPWYWSGTVAKTFGSVTAVQSQDGSVSAPAYSYSGDTNTGWYRIGADNEGLALGGVKYLDASATTLAVATTSLASNYRVLLQTNNSGTERPTYEMARGGGGSAVLGISGQSNDIVTGDVANNTVLRGSAGLILSANGSNAQVTVASGGAVTIAETTGGTGNVPHNCTRRTATNSVSASQSSVSCSAGEKAVGGGCDCSGGGCGSTSYVCVNSLNATSVDCRFCNVAPTNTIAQAYCCTY